MSIYIINTNKTKENKKSKYITIIKYSYDECLQTIL